jgi:hypothetical protein
VAVPQAYDGPATVLCCLLSCTRRHGCCFLLLGPAQISQQQWWGWTLVSPPCVTRVSRITLKAMTRAECNRRHKHTLGFKCCTHMGSHWLTCENVQLPAKGGVQLSSYNCCWGFPMLGWREITVVLAITPKR